jgi:hypothetical protein
MTPHGPSQEHLSAETIAQALRCEEPGCSCGKREGKRFKIHCPAYQEFLRSELPSTCQMISRAGTEGPWA